MQIDYLRYFMETANVGSISKAADSLFMKRSNLSTCLSKLEEAVGTSLFERNTKGVSLTTNGKLFYDWVESVSSSYRELQANFKETEKLDAIGDMYIYATTSMATQVNLYVITEFSSQWPNVSINYSTNSIESVLASVSQKNNAVAFVSLHETDLPLLDEYPNLIFLNLKEIPFAVYTAPDHPLANSHKTVSLKTLRDYHLLQYAQVGEASFFYSFFKSRQLTVPKFSAVTDLLMYQKMLSSGKYISLGLAKPYTPALLKDFAMIPVREKLTCTQAILATPEALKNPQINKVVQLYHKILRCPMAEQL